MRVVVFFGIAAAVLCGQVAFRLFGPNTPIKAKSGAEIYETNLAGIEYRIPVEYFKYVSGRPKRYATEMLIDASLPDMRPLLPDMPETIRAEKGDSGSVAIILVTDAKSTTSLKFRFSVEKTAFSPLHFEKSAFGLLKYSSAKGNAGFPIEDIAPVYLNGQQVREPSPEQKRGRSSEFYVDDESDNPSVYMVCHGDTAERAPSCTEHFVDLGLLFQVSFNKRHLSEWASIKNNIVALMQRMTDVGSTH
jgi:hypothetical protein